MLRFRCNSRNEGRFCFCKVASPNWICLPADFWKIVLWSEGLPLAGYFIPAQDGLGVRLAGRIWLPLPTPRTWSGPVEYASVKPFNYLWAYQMDSASPESPFRVEARAPATSLADPLVQCFETCPSTFSAFNSYCVKLIGVAVWRRA